MYNDIDIKTFSLLGFSGTTGATLHDLMSTHKNIYALSADLSNPTGINCIKNDFEDRFINVGIAEQELLSMAGGIASLKNISFVTEYATFITTRALDQVKVNMAYMKLPIIAIGCWSGFATGDLGATHMSLEDIAIMRALPNITILSPADCLEYSKMLSACVSYNKPCYIRGLPDGRYPIIYKKDFNFEIGKSIELVEGADLTIFATGSMVQKALKVSKKFREQNINVSVVNVNTIKPFDSEMLIKKSKSPIVSIEEHNIYGGLGSVIAECLIKNNINTKHLLIGVDDYYPHPSDYDSLLKEVGLDEVSIYNKINNFINKN